MTALMTNLAESLKGSSEFVLCEDLTLVHGGSNKLSMSYVLIAIKVNQIEDFLNVYITNCLLCVEVFEV
jgi:hypothetical protein